MADNSINTEINKTAEMLESYLKGKVDDYELYFSSSEGISIESKDLKVDSFKVSKSMGVGLRTLTGGKPGFGFSTVMDRDALRKMVDDAISASGEASSDKFRSFPESQKQSFLEDLNLIDSSMDTMTEDEKIQIAIDIEKSAIEYDKRVKRVRGASYSESRGSSVIINSQGVDVSSDATFYSASVMAIAEADDDSQMGYEMGLGHKSSDIDAIKIGRGAAKRAVDVLGGKGMESEKCPAVFENSVVNEFLGTFSSAFLADNVQKGKSMLMDKKGQQILSPLITIYDDGLLKGGWASSLYDSEGVPTETKTLVDGGECRGFLYDTYTAKKEGVTSTGNGKRGGFKGSPNPGVTNFYMKNGDTSLDDLIKEAGRGLFITDVMGVHTIDAISGDFSLGAGGFWIENGEIKHPVRGIAISGNLLELFSRVALVGSDLRHMGSVGAPSLLFDYIEASGG